MSVCARLCVLVATLVHLGSGSRILAVFPTVSKSHFDFFQPLLVALATRGHEVTVVNSYPQPIPMDNYTDINLKDFKHVFFNDVDFDDMPHIPISFMDNHQFLISQVPESESPFGHPDVQRLLSSREKFDLVVVELWNTDLFLGFAHRFNAPVIAMSSCPILPWANTRFGNPDNPAYVSSIFHPKLGPLDFSQRLYNTFQVLVSKILYQFVYNIQSENIARRVFGNSLPPLSELAYNTSLMFVNTHHTLHGARPFSPQVIEVGGIHVKNPRPLEKDLDRWMNESSHGVIYFSFGSMLRGASLPPEKVRVFLQVFGALPQRVLWKWEDDNVAGLPTNVRTMKWLPQRDVLAHPKVRVFISHGGLMGTTEAVVSGVPVLGIPMYGDQPHNVAALVNRGAGIHMDYNNITVTSLKSALHALLHDPSFSENAKQLSRRFLDRPLSPLETAVYWTEYVIRHHGAPHLQSAAVHLTWYQYYLLDVAALILLIFIVLIVGLNYFVKVSLKLLCNSRTTKVKTS